MSRVLYISYDGLLEPLGQSQVFGYLNALARIHHIVLVSYEKKEDWQNLPRRRAVQEAVARAGIRWLPLRYHKRPSSVATTFDVAVGFLTCSALAISERVQVVHARSYVPAVLALVLKKAFGTRFIFDMRGLWADERAERAGLPKSGGVYRTAKWFERQFFTHADVVISLTTAAVRAIEQFPYLAGERPLCRVIPTCTDLEAFRPPQERGAEPFTLGYVGSADSSYLFEPVLRCFKLLRDRRPGARLLVITRSSHTRLRSLVSIMDIDQAAVEIKSVAHHEVAREIGRMHAGVFFLKAGFSALATMPTKLGEFLACGVPCLGNAGIGDVDAILEGESVGVVLPQFGREAEASAVDRLLELCADPGLPKRCAEAARKIFSLERGIDSYDRIYRSLGG